MSGNEKKKPRIGNAYVPDMEKLFTWLDDNCSREDKRGRRETPFYDAAREDIVALSQMDRNIYYDDWYLKSSPGGWMIAGMKDAIRAAAADGQPLALYAVHGAACLVGYGEKKTMILPTDALDIRYYKDYSRVTRADITALTGDSIPQADNTLIPGGESLATLADTQSEYDAEIERLEREVRDVKEAKTGELKALQDEINRQMALLKEKQDALLASIREKQNAIAGKIDELNRQVKVMKAQIYGIRCYTGETVNFTQITSGKDAPFTEPVVVYQKVRYLDEEMGRHMALYFWKYSADSMQMSFLDILRAREDFRELFVPASKCISVIAMSRSGKTVSQAFTEDGEMLPFLAKYEEYHGKQVAIMVRSGENIYIGWTDADMVELDTDDVFLTPGKKEVMAEDANNEKATSSSVKVSRFYLLNLLQGLLDNGQLLRIPEKEFLFARNPRYVMFSAASGMLADTKYGTFEEMLARSADIPLKAGSGSAPGDPVISMTQIFGGQDAYINERGIGSRNRTHDAEVPPLTIMPINKILEDLTFSCTIARYKVADLEKLEADGVTEIPDELFSRDIKADAMPGSEVSRRKAELTLNSDVAYGLSREHGAYSTWPDSLTLECLNWKPVKEVTDGYRKSDTRIANHIYCDGTKSNEPSITDYYRRSYREVDLMRYDYYVERVIDAQLVKRAPHYFVSVPMREKRWSWEYAWSPETDARANMEIMEDEMLSPTYLCLTWVDHVLKTKHIGTIRRADVTFDYAQLLPVLNLLRQYLDNRQDEEENLLAAAGLSDWIKAHEDWDVALVEWRIEKRIRRLTPHSAKQFARYILSRDAT